MNPFHTPTEYKTAPGWHGILRSAFERGAAHGLFIDLQERFKTDFTVSSYGRAQELADALDRRNIWKSWVIWPKHSPVESAHPYSACRDQLAGDDRLASPAPRAEEIVYTKDRINGLSNPAMRECLGDWKKPAIIAAGVRGYACFGTTITDILGRYDCDLIVPYDAADFRNTDHAHGVLNALAQEARITPKGRLHITDTRDLCAFLDTLNPP